MRAFLLFESVIAIFIIGILCLFAKHTLHHQIYHASEFLYTQLLYAQNLALTHSTQYTHISQTQWLKDKFPSIYQEILISQPTQWQIQFHLKGIYTKNSFSLYLDTPRYANTTHYDNRPMSGDLIAIQGANLRCLSGYNNTNISDFCKNNAETKVRLQETFGVTITLKMQENCKESNTARIFFDQFGKAYCGEKPTPITEPFIITLRQNQYSQKICLLPERNEILQGEECNL